MTGYHTRWARPQDAADDPERIAIREALAFGKALYDIRTALGLTVAELALRAALTDDDIERIEEGGTEPTIPVLRRLAAALNADVRLTGGHDLGSVVRNPRRLNHAVGTQTQLLYAPEPPLCASPAHSAFVSSRIQNRPFCSESIAAAR
jgi:transcriptional regulator with XRE-family HTH domain